MAHGTTLAGLVFLGLIGTAGTGHAQTLTLDGPELVPKRQTITRDIDCTDDNHCVERHDLNLECRNGVVVQASLTQPRGARATLTRMTAKGKPVRDETLRTVNLLLSTRAASSVVEVVGMCSHSEATVLINTYADAYLATRHEDGPGIVVTLTADGQQSVGAGPIQ